MVEADLVECHCGARIHPRLLVRNDVGEPNRCPECRMWWSRCPACLEWEAPFYSYEPDTECSNVACRLDGSVKSDLRLGRVTLRELRQDPDVPQFEPLDGEDGDSARATPGVSV